MSNIPISRYQGETLSSADFNGKASGMGLFLAIALHMGLLLLMIFMQQHTSYNTKLPPSIQVNLVSYSPKLEDLLKPEKKQSKKIKAKKLVKKVKPKPVKKVIKKEIKPVEKKVFIEKKTPEPSEIIEAAKENINERVDEQEQNKIKDILSELQEKVEEQEMSDDYEEEEVQESGYRPWKDISAQNIYNSIFTTKIQKNWVFNENLAQIEKSNEEINVLVMIKIMKNGDLGDIWIETKSGNDFLDKSAIRAIKKAAPFPPFPKELSAFSYEVGLLFSPKGLK